MGYKLNQHSSNGATSTLLQFAFRIGTIMAHEARSRGTMHDLRAALIAKNRAYQALIVRFVVGRYGRDNIGFMWTVVEPMLLCLGVMVIWSFTKAKNDHGVSAIGFVFTGYMTLTLWRHQTGHMVNILRHMKFLTIFHNIDLFDTIISRLLLEFFSVTSAALIAYAILYIFGVLDPPYDLTLMFQGWLIMGALGAGTGILVASLSELSDIVEKIYQPFQYFLLPFGGCFYMIDWLPDSVKEYAQYMPLVHSYEIVRAGYFGPNIPTYGEMAYPLIWALVMGGIGCFFFERIRDSIE